MKQQYRVCPHCGCHLDAGERCECEREETLSAKNNGEGT